MHEACPERAKATEWARLPRLLNQQPLATYGVTVNENGTDSVKLPDVAVTVNG